MEDKNNNKLDAIKHLIGDETFKEPDLGGKREEPAVEADLDVKIYTGQEGGEAYEDDEYDDVYDDEEPGGRKRHPWRTALLILLALVVLLGGVAAGFTIVTLNKINRTNWNAEEAIDPSQEDFEPDDEAGDDTIKPEDVTWDDDGGINVVSSPYVKNILLIGQDRRPGERRARSDSMIICSLNEKTGIITLVSLMRDMYVPIPGYSDNRINAAYAFGGMTLLNQVIKEDFGIIIDGNVEVDFNGFIQVMGMIAPLNIELKSYEAEYLNRYNNWNLTTGVNALNAEQLLAYSRIRKVGNSDYERTDRQRRVLATAFAKLRTLPINEIYNVVNAALPCVTTDMRNGEILDYVSTVLTKGATIGGNYRLPVSGSYSNQTIRGMMVLVPDLSSNSKTLQKYLYGDLIE